MSQTVHLDSFSQQHNIIKASIIPGIIMDFFFPQLRDYTYPKPLQGKRPLICLTQSFTLQGSESFFLFEDTSVH